MKEGCPEHSNSGRWADTVAQACGLTGTRPDAAAAAVGELAGDAAGEQRSRVASAATGQVVDLVAGDGQNAA